MNRIELRGVIVPSFYDTDWTQEYIEKGLITPESTFRRNLGQADAGEPLELYINSPGGSVFSAYEMINALREWKRDTKQEINIVIGAMAASAASTIVLMAGGEVSAHQNAMLMFHGATTETWAGKDGHKDAAELLEKINNEVQQVLIQKHKMNPDTVAEWFAEGRMGWMNADEAYKAGIVSEVIGSDAEEVQYGKEDLAAIDAKGLDVAALLEEPKDGSDNAEDDAEEPDSKNTGDEPGVPGGDDAEYQRGLADGIAQGKAQITAEYAEQIDALKQDRDAAVAESRKFQGQADKLKTELQKAHADADKRAADLRAQIDDATEKLRKYVSGALRFAPAIETWAEAMQKCGGDYVKAKELYPELLEKYKSETRQ